MLTKIIEFVKKYKKDIILIIGVVLISLLSFAAGYIMGERQSREPMRFESNTFYKSEISHFKLS